MQIMRGSLWIAALAAIAGFLAQPAAAQDTSRQDVAQSQRKTKQRGPEQAPAKAAPDPKAEQEAAREAKDREERAALERRLAEATAELANSAAALTYATIGLVVVTASLWLMAYLQSREIKAAVLAAQESSAAARRSTEIVQRGLVLTQRATVVVQEPKAIWLRDAGQALVGCRLLVTWQNVGGTPTKDMVAAVAGVALEGRPRQHDTLPKTNPRTQPAIMGPHSAINSSRINIPVGLVADILQHKRHYLFCGWADYNDVFESTPRHRVEFCYRVEFEGDLDAQRLQATFHIHGKHNRHCDSDANSRQGGNDGNARVEHTAEEERTALSAAGQA